jgi:hypothetical protein
LNTTDAGVHYQLFLAYSRLRMKEEADRELRVFKQFQQANKHAETPLGMTTGPASETETLPPLPASATGETSRPHPPQD